FAGIDGSAQPATVLDNDLHALFGGAIEHGIGNEVAHGAFDGAAGFAAAVDGVGGGADHHGFEFFDRFVELGDADRVIFIGRDRGVQQQRLALRRDDVAIVVPG